MIRAGAGLYYGRIDNAVVLAALTQTGSLNGDLNYFFKPTRTPARRPSQAVFPATAGDRSDARSGFPFAANFRPQEIDQAVFGIEQELPEPSGCITGANAMTSLGRRLPISIDTNIAAPY